MAASYYYKLPAGGAKSTLLGPVTQAALLELRSTLPPETEVCHAETETWTHLGDNKLTAIQDDGTIAIQFAPAACYLILFAFLGFVAWQAKSSPNAIIGGFFGVIEWIYGVLSIILFRFRHGSQRQFWHFMLAFAAAGIAGLVIVELS